MKGVQKKMQDVVCPLEIVTAAVLEVEAEAQEEGAGVQWMKVRTSTVEEVEIIEGKRMDTVAAPARCLEKKGVL